MRRAKRDGRALCGTITAPPVTWREGIATFKRGLIERTLTETRGNRTQAARALSVQRIDLLRLIQERGVSAPPPLLGGPHVPTADITR